MRKRFWPRVLKSVLPVALLCGVGGWALAWAAGAYVTDSRYSGDELRETLVWRLPLTLAAWGGGITFLCELFRHLWAQPIQSAAEAKTQAVDAEQLLMQLIEQAEAAEEDRNPQPVFGGCAPPPDELFSKHSA